MLESHTENALATWTVEQCAFSIEYSPRVLDDIRLAVVDAFFSLPRGGAEIGGILLGRRANHRVTITDYVALDCEHASGPSFVLSPRDLTKLAELLAAGRGTPGGAQPVGWYHSHTRSEINLTPADIEIHKRYFPEQWQVALVLKPHAFQPCRAGFFFREPDGSIHSTASYQEITLEPLGVRTLPAEAPPPAPVPAPVSVPAPAPRPPRREPDPPIPMPGREQAEPRSTIERIELPEFAAAVDSPEPEVQPEAQPDAVEVPPPAFTQAPPARSWGGAGILIALAAGLAFGATAYQTRDMWLPHGTPPAKAPYVGLSMLDRGGQLQIHWDRESPAVRSAEEGSLVIEDGSLLPQAVQLNSTHLRMGSFIYGRQSERVDVALTLHGPSGQTVREVATYLGKLPERTSLPPDDSAVRQPFEENQELRGRAQKLEKTVEDLRQQLKKEQKRTRFANQSPESVKSK